MIMWIPQLIRCGIHMKSEISVDSSAPCARAPRVRPRTGLTVTTHQSDNGIRLPLDMVDKYKAIVLGT